METMAAQRWLDREVSARGDFEAATILVSRGYGPRSVARWPVDGPPDDELISYAQAWLAGGPQAARRTGQDTSRILTGAVRSAGEIVGAVAIRLRDADVAEASRLASTGARVAAHALQTARATSARAAPSPVEAMQAEPGDAAPVPLPITDRPPQALEAAAQRPARRECGGDGDPTLALITAILDEPRLERSVVALATALSRIFACDRAFVGMTAQRFVVVRAMSDGTALEPDDDLARIVGAAMDEAADQGAIIVAPQHPDDRPRITQAHAALLAAGGGHVVLTVPLHLGGTVVGALTMERRDSRRFDAATVARVEAIARPLASVLHLKLQAERSAWERTRQSLVDRFEAWTPRQRLLLAPVTLLAGATLAGLMAVPGSYRISAPTRLEGQIQRAVVAPVDGYLKSALVRPGDIVAEGQVLAELSDEDLRLERQRWQSEVARHENTYAEAQARQDRSQLVIADARVAESRAQLAQIDQQLARTQLRAPFEALVIQGDLTRQLGAPVKRGDALLTLAPSREFRVMLEIDERDVRGLEVGAHGTLALSAMPERRFDLVVERVMPVARADSGRNLFEAEARLAGLRAGEAAALRHGLQGVARVDAGQRPLAWIGAHRALDWLWLQWWSWLG